MIESLFQYYGLDWIGMIATFFSLWWIGDKHWSGFVVGGMLGSVWIFDWKRTCLHCKPNIFLREYPWISKVARQKTDRLTEK